MAGLRKRERGGRRNGEKDMGMMREGSCEERDTDAGKERRKNGKRSDNSLIRKKATSMKRSGGAQHGKLS